MLDCGSVPFGGAAAVRHAEHPILRGEREDDATASERGVTRRLRWRRGHGRRIAGGVRRSEDHLACDAHRERDARALGRRPRFR